MKNIIYWLTLIINNLIVKYKITEINKISTLNIIISN